MIHPDSELRPIDHIKGRGIFATAFIPSGTVTYVKDELEIEIPADDPLLDNPLLTDIIETYSYIDEHNRRILSWDHAKYVNHCCHCNTMSTGYGFEIAIRDIQPNDEITDEYGLFNLQREMKLSCSHQNCRGSVNGTDIDFYYKVWDRQVKDALRYFNEVAQPLVDFIDPHTRDELQAYLLTGNDYKSVAGLRV